LATVKEVAEMLRGSRSRNNRGVAPAKIRTYGGIIYDSQAECKQAFELDQQKSAGLIYAWERQIAMPIRLNGVHVCTVNVDFRVKDKPESEWRYIEVKGFETETYKLKKKLLLAMYGPNFPYEVVRV